MTSPYNIDTIANDIVSLDNTKQGRAHGGLQAFQAHISQRIAQAQSELQNTNALLAIQIKGYRLLLPLTEINELVTPPPITRVPLAKRWITGLAVARAEVVTVFDLSYCLTIILPSLPDTWKTPAYSNNINSNFNNTGIKQSDSKCILLSNIVGTQLALMSDKIIGTVATNHAGYTEVYNKNNLNNNLNNNSNNNLNNNLNNNYKYHDCLNAVWQDNQNNSYLELSLINLIQSKEFLNLTF